MRPLLEKMSKNKKILVTGGAGYIGSVLVRQLLARGYKVKVADVLRSGGESLLEVYRNPDFEFVKADIRDKNAMQAAVQGCDYIIHLAAIVGDPACKQEPELAKSINLDGGKQLYEIAEKAGVKGFVFASTCSNYGKMEDPNALLDENGKLAPVSLYAETKVAFEQFLLGQPKTNKCIPTCLRFSTVYGVSPRIRFDLTVNEFTRELQLGRELTIFGEQFWRPYCHVEDLARASWTIIESPVEKVAFEVFNVGDTSENYTKRMIVEEIRKQLPNSKVTYIQKTEDPRDYRVKFEKITNMLGFKITKKVPEGIAEIIKMLDLGLLENPDDKKYSNT